jgi:hypothetical protein
MTSLGQKTPIGFHRGNPFVDRRRGQPLHRLHMADPIVEIPGGHLVGIKGFTGTRFPLTSEDFYDTKVFLWVNSPLPFSCIQAWGCMYMFPLPSPILE